MSNRDHDIDDQDPVQTPVAEIGDLHELSVVSMKLPTGRHSGYVEYRINGIRQQDRHGFHAGIFATEDEAIDAAREVARGLMQSVQNYEEISSEPQMFPVSSSASSHRRHGRTLH